MHNIRETQAVSAQAAGSKSMPEHLSAPAKQLFTLLSAGALYVDEAADVYKRQAFITVAAPMEIPCMTISQSWP